MAKDFSTLEDSNRSSNPSIHQISLPLPLPQPTQTPAHGARATARLDLSRPQNPHPGPSPQGGGEQWPGPSDSCFVTCGDGELRG